MDQKNWWQSKTVWANIFTTLMGIVALVDVNFGTNFTHSPWYGFLVSMAGTLGITGRVMTNTMIEKKVT